MPACAGMTWLGCGPVAGFEEAFQKLAGGGAGEFGVEVDGAGAFEVGEF